MKVVTLKENQEWTAQEETVLVLGYFDGLHKGHKALFDRARAIADQYGWTVSVLTFPESPKLAFTRFSPELLYQLTSPEKRIALMADYGVDSLYLTDFTSHFAAQTPRQFVEQYVKGLNARALVAGFDYHFGKGRADVTTLRELFDGSVEVVEEVQLDGEKISSTRIRENLKTGDVATVNQLLGYTFTTEGIVVHGDARGRTIGYPTANLAPFERVHLPGDGVYVADVEIDGLQYRAMASVGKNVTFDGKELRLEAHVFDFHEDIYGKRIRIDWLDKIRDMQRFDGIEALMKQMQSDETIAKNWTKKG